MVQVGKGRVGGGRTESASTGESCRKLRRVGVARFEANGSEVIWPDMTVAMLCSTVSGWLFPLYLANMRHYGEWVDATFLHALGR
eukprot:2062939-Lingulodinium_polyedra.AAC.1